jgi:hypothetical protein
MFEFSSFLPLSGGTEDKGLPSGMIIGSLEISIDHGKAGVSARINDGYQWKHGEPRMRAWLHRTMSGFTGG